MKNIFIALIALMLSATGGIATSPSDTQSHPYATPAPKPPQVMPTGHFTWFAPKSYGSFTVSGYGHSQSHRCDMIKMFGEYSIFIVGSELKPLQNNDRSFVFIDVVDKVFENTMSKSGRVIVTVRDDDGNEMSKVLHWNFKPDTRNARIMMHPSFYLAIVHYSTLTLDFKARNDTLLEVDLKLDGGLDAVDAALLCIRTYLEKHVQKPLIAPVHPKDF